MTERMEEQACVRRAYAPLTKAEEDALIARAVRGEAGAMAEMHALYTEFRRERRLWGRTSYPEQDAEGRDAWEHCGSAEDMAEQADLRLLVRGLLRNVMHRLTEREKEILSLHYFRDLTLRRIAALLGTSASAVSKSKANLLRKLRAGAGVECVC